MRQKLCAHRGWASRYPENSLAAVRGALKLGLLWVEIDVQLSADGVPIVFHDAKLWRMHRRVGDVRKLGWKALKALGIARLSQVARLFRDTKARLFVEIKEESLLRFGREAVLEAVLKELGRDARRCILISFDEPVLDLARGRCSLSLGAVLRRWKRIGSPWFRRLKPEFTFCGTRSLPRQGGLKIRGSRLCLWEVPDPSEAARYWGRGADMVETFAVENYFKGGKQ